MGWVGGRTCSCLDVFCFFVVFCFFSGSVKPRLQQRMLWWQEGLVLFLSEEGRSLSESSVFGVLWFS